MENMKQVVCYLNQKSAIIKYLALLPKVKEFEEEVLI